MKILPTNRQMSRSKLCDLEVIDERGNFVATDGQDSRVTNFVFKKSILNSFHLTFNYCEKKKLL